LQNEIVNYYRAKNALPQSLDQLTNSISGIRPPNDPQSRRPYEYRMTGTLSFQLCADFSLPTVLQEKPLAYSTPGVSGWNWSHGTGRECFTRTIDPALNGSPPVPCRAPLPTVPQIR
jgi:hypothetical protein